MNFLEAVKALNDGLCEGIQWKGDKHYFIINDCCLQWEDGVDQLPSISALLSEDWELLCVKQYEEVEVVKWLTIAQDGSEKITDHPLPPWPNTTQTLLKGKIKRPIKPKVKRREEVGMVGVFGTFVSSDVIKTIPADAKIFAEWEE